MAKESTKQGGRGGRKLAMVIGLGLHAEGQQLFSGVADTHGKKNIKTSKTTLANENQEKLRSSELNRQ